MPRINSSANTFNNTQSGQIGTADASREPAPQHPGVGASSQGAAPEAVSSKIQKIADLKEKIVSGATLIYETYEKEQKKANNTTEAIEGLKVYEAHVENIKELDKISPRERHASVSNKEFARLQHWCYTFSRKIFYNEQKEAEADPESSDEDIYERAFKNESKLAQLLRCEFKLDPQMSAVPIQMVGAQPNIPGRPSFTLLDQLKAHSWNVSLEKLFALGAVWKKLDENPSLKDRLQQPDTKVFFCQIASLFEAKNKTLNMLIRHKEESELIGQAYTDLATVCWDVVVWSINNESVLQNLKQSVEENLHLSQLSPLIDKILRHCADFARVTDEWLKDRPLVKPKASGKSQAKSARPEVGGIISVVMPSGLRVVQAVENDAEVDLDPDLDSTRLATFAHLEVKETPFSKVRTLVQEGQDLLARAQDIDGEFRDVTARKGHTDPDILWRSYGCQAERWQAQSKEMNKLAKKVPNLAGKLSADEKNAIEGLSNLPALLKNQAKVLKEKALELTQPSTRWSLIKAYATPKDKYLAELLENDQVIVGRLIALPSDPPNTTFEIEIKAKDDNGGGTTQYPPVYFHLHTDNSVGFVSNLKKFGFSAFSAMHLKSAADRRHGRNWSDAQIVMGLDPHVHRSKVGEVFFRKLINLCSVE